MGGCHKMAKGTVIGQIHKKTAKDEFLAKVKKAKRPDDFKKDEDFLRYAIGLFDDDLNDDKDNREEAVEDVKFMAGDQWEKWISDQRASDQKPTLTFNRLPAFVAQVLGTRRLSTTDIKIIPDDAAHKEAAKVREGLIRSIQKLSKADIAYNKAMENQVIAGEGSFRIDLEYAYDDVFEQDAKIKGIQNPFAVVWDRQSVEPSGNDAGHCFVIDDMTPADFKLAWPNATSADLSTDTRTIGYDIGPDWATNDVIRVVDFWRMRSRIGIVALLQDEEGNEDVVDITDMPLEDFIDKIVTDENGNPVVREVDRKYVQMYKISATDILEGPYELPIDRVPVFRVPGWVINVGKQRRRFGLIRFLKDPQKLHNYWRSVIAEKLMLTPKAVWLAAEGTVEGREDEYRKSHLTNDTLLQYDANEGPPPTRVQPAQIEQGLIAEANMAAQDLRDISNIHEASLGQQSNEVSGKAILARQRVGETGTTIYQDNLDLAIEEAGRVLNQLIPIVYDTRRTIKVLGEEGREMPPVLINGETNENSVDITSGKYSVTSSTGPSYVTKRVEAGESMLNMVNAAPQTMAVALDKIVEAQDWPGASEIARRLRSQLPAGLVSQEDMTDEELAAAKQAGEAAAAQQQQQQQILAVDLREKTARADQSEALALQAQANAAKAMASIDIDTFKALSDVQDGRVQTVLNAMKAFEDLTRDTVTGV